MDHLSKTNVYSLPFTNSELWVHTQCHSVRHVQVERWVIILRKLSLFPRFLLGTTGDTSFCIFFNVMGVVNFTTLPRSKFYTLPFWEYRVQIARLPTTFAVPGFNRQY